MRTFIAFAVLAAAAAGAAAQDTLRLTDPAKGSIQGEILSMTYKTVEIEIEVGGVRAPVKVAAKEIRDIEIDANRRPFDFSMGLDAMNKNEYATAVERFERTRKDARDVIKQTSAINIIRCHYHNNDHQAALAAIKAFRQEKPDTFYLLETYDCEYRCHLARQDVNGIAQAAAGLEQRGKAERLDEWVKLADVMRAQLLEFQGKWPEALAIYSRYARDRDVGEEASLGELRCLRELKNWTQMRAKAEIIITGSKAKKGSERLLTGAYSARGEVSLQSGNLKDALLDFMLGVTVINKGGETSREHERALASAALACARIAAAEKGKERKDTYRERAQEVLADLDKIYPNSAHRAEVAKAIQEIR